MYVVELFLPIGGAATEVELTKLRVLLTEKFGGVTAFTRSPAQGAWRAPHSGHVEKDDIIIVEVMTETLDRNWWSALKADLERSLKQTEILIRAHEGQYL
jgi:hypothetical protein